MSDDHPIGDTMPGVREAFAFDMEFCRHGFGRLILFDENEKPFAIALCGPENIREMHRMLGNVLATLDDQPTTESGHDRVH